MVRQNSQVDVCVILLLSLLVTACGDDNDSPTGAQPEHPHRIQLDGSRVVVQRSPASGF